MDIGIESATFSDFFSSNEEDNFADVILCATSAVVVKPNDVSCGKFCLSLGLDIPTVLATSSDRLVPLP